MPYFNAPGAFVIAAIVVYFEINYVLSIWVSFVLMPLIDSCLPLDKYNVPKGAEKKFERDWRFKIPLYFVLCMDFILYFYLLNGISTGKFGNTFVDFMIYVIGGAIMGATNTTAGHELFHKRPLVHKMFGILPWFKMLSGHLYMYHLQLHHKYAGHPVKDPSLPWFNQSVYSYCSWNSIKAYIVTYQYEERRLAKKKHNPSTFSILSYNRVILFNIIHVLYLIFIWQYLGAKTALFQVLYAFCIVMLTDSTNYVEHYGLQLKQLNKDKPNEEPVYEAMSRQVSWDALQPMSSSILFKLQRHSDHHMFAYKPYQILETTEDTPVLPLGYTGSMLLAYCPPVWMKIMNPAVEAVNRGERVAPELQKKNKKLTFIYCGVIWTIMTYITFFVVGLKAPTPYQ